MNNIDRLDGIVKQAIGLVGKVPIPAIIEISPSDFCNNHCYFCPKSKPNYPNHKLFIGKHVITKLRDDLIDMDFCGLITFSGFGEPLAHPNLTELVEILSSRFRVDVVTNGTLLTEQNLSKLILSGVNKILVSAYTKKIESHMNHLFEHVNPTLYEIRNRHSVEFPISNRGGIMYKNRKKSPCYYMNYTCLIDWNGDVTACPHDFNRNIRFGNIMNEHLIDIWGSEQMKSRRRTLSSSRETFFPCKYCDVDGCVIGSEHRKLWEICDQS